VIDVLGVDHAATREDAPVLACEEGVVGEAPGSRPGDRIEIEKTLDRLASTDCPFENFTRIFGRHPAVKDITTGQVHEGALTAEAPATDKAGSRIDDDLEPGAGRLGSQFLENLECPECTTAAASTEPDLDRLNIDR